MRLLAEAAAADEHEALAQLGVLVGELHRDAASQRLADDGGVLDTEDGEQVAQSAGERAERVVAQGFGRLTVPEEVGCDHVEVAGEQRQRVAPGARAARHAVDQQHRRPGARSAVGHVVPVERHVLLGDLPRAGLGRGPSVLIGHGDDVTGR